MTDDTNPFADREPKLDMKLPLDGWVYVRVNDEQLTAFSVHEGENLEVFVERDRPEAAVD